MIFKALQTLTLEVRHAVTVSRTRQYSVIYIGDTEAAVGVLSVIYAVSQWCIANRKSSRHVVRCLISFKFVLVSESKAKLSSYSRKYASVQSWCLKVLIFALASGAVPHGFMLFCPALGAVSLEQHTVARRVWSSLGVVNVCILGFLLGASGYVQSLECSHASVLWLSINTTLLALASGVI